ncbi:MAG: T9SS type A sorting domain-containing protein [Bacteroidia bacterium]|nr:T9SS type A sorting domain-containing protein [Bacteroidia bacterium]
MNKFNINRLSVLNYSLIFVVLLFRFNSTVLATVNYCDSINLTTSLPATLYLCDVSSATLNAGPGFATYLWSNGATTQSIQVSYSGFYSVTVTNDSGCIAIDTAAVSLIHTSLSSINSNVCQGTQTSVSVTSTSANINSLSFNGINNYFTASDAGFPTANMVRTFEAWVYNSGQATRGYLFSYGNWATDQAFALYIDSLNQLKLTINQSTYTCSNTIPLNSWVQISVSTDIDSKYNFYINGIFINSGFITNYNTVSNTVMNVGKSGNAPNQGYFNGKMDEIRVWNFGLSIDDIQSYYYVRLNNGINSHLLRYWDCNYLSGSTMYDINWHIANVNGAILSASVPYNIYQFIYSWNTGATGSSLSLLPAQTSTYHLNAWDGISTCSDSIIITVINSPVLPDTLLLCNTPVYILNAGNGFTTYHWSNGYTGQSFSATLTGSYSVTVTGQGCTFNHTSYLNFLSSNIIEGDTVICNGNSITLHSSPAGSSGYYWNSGQTSQNITVTPAYTTLYVLTTYNSLNTCNDSVLVYVTNPINSDLPATDFACNTNSITLSVPNQIYVSYLWSNGASTPVITISGSGLYIVTVTDVMGCSRSDSTLVTMYNIDIVQNDTTTCSGLPITLHANANNPSILWSDGMTGSSITVNPATTTTYSATLTSGSNTCSDQVTIFVGPPINLNFQDSVFTCNESFISLDAASPSATYHWNNGATTPSIQVTNSGMYSVSVTNSAGCTATAQSVVSVINVNITASADNICADSLIIISTNSSGYTYHWSNGAVDPVIFVTPSMSTVYFVTVTDGYSSCIYSQPIVVIPVNTGLIYGPTVVYADTTVTYYVNPHAGSTYSWYISGGLYTASFIDSITIHWGIGDTGYVAVVETNIYGCTGPLVELYVHIHFHQGVPEYFTTNQFRVIPNPFNDEALIMLPEDDRNGIIRIYDITGKLILEIQESNRDGIILHGNKIPRGVFIIRHSGKNSFYQKMIRY